MVHGSLVPPYDGGSLTLTSIFTKDAFWRVQHQIMATAYLVRDDSCGSPLYLPPAGGLC